MNAKFENQTLDFFCIKMKHITIIIGACSCTSSTLNKACCRIANPWRDQSNPTHQRTQRPVQLGKTDAFRNKDVRQGSEGCHCWQSPHVSNQKEALGEFRVPIRSFMVPTLFHIAVEPGRDTRKQTNPIIIENPKQVLGQQTRTEKYLDRFEAIRDI